MKNRIALCLALGLVLGAQAPIIERAETRPVTELVPDDPDLSKAIAPKQAEIRASFDKPLVKAPDGLFRGRPGEENLLGYWIADVMRERAQRFVGAPVRAAITNSGGIRANLRPGQLTVGSIFEVAPFENELVVVDITGAELLHVIKNGILRRGGEPMSGVKASVTGTPDKPVVSITWEDGTPIKPEEILKLATNDYIVASGDSLLEARKDRVLLATGLSLRQILLDACTELQKAGQTLTAPKGGRYAFAPEVYQAIRDKKLSW